MPRPLLRPDPNVLASTDLFAGVEVQVLADAIDHAHTRSLPKGTRIFSQGDPAEICHVLIDGRVKISQTGPDGQQVVVHFIGPGQSFGTLASFIEGGYPGDAVALIDSVEVHWTTGDMHALMLRHGRIALNALTVLGTRLRELQDRVRELQTQRVERRIAHALLRLVRQAGRRVVDEEGPGVEIAFAVSRQDLADMTGATLHTVSRTLSAWEAKGILDGGRQRIVIRKPHDVVRIAEELA